jgi:hypothetical protein
MWRWLRRILGQPTLGTEVQKASITQYRLPKLSELYVEPDGPPDDFDRASCERLLRKIAELGAKDIGDLSNIAVSLEDFFEGNRSKHSIAANVVPAAPYDTAEVFCVPP